MYKIAIFAFVVIFISSNAHADIKFKSLSKKKWTQIESDHFEIITDMSLKKAKLTAMQLEGYRTFAGLWLNQKSSKVDDKKIVFFITEKTSTWRSMGLDENWVSLTAYKNNNSAPYIFSNVKGFFGNSFRKANKGRSVILNSIATDILRASGIGNNYPLWFRTGFAYYLATYSEPKDQIMLGSIAAYSGRLSSLINSKVGGPIRVDIESLFSQKKMINRTPGSSTKAWQDKANKFYMQSFLTVHYLYSSNELRNKMFKFVGAVAKGESSEVAMQKIFGKTFADFEKDLKAYVNGSSLTARVMDKQQVESLFPATSEHKAESINASVFFAEFTKAVLALSDKTISNQDKQSYFKEYREKYPIDLETGL